MESDLKCGIGPWYPGWLQKFRSISCFTAVFSISTCFTSSLIFYVSSQITALERQFGFSSFQSGFLLSCNEIGFLLTCLFVSFIARKVHIPRILALSTFISGICGIFSSLAFHISPKDQLYVSDVVIVANQSRETITVVQEVQMCSSSLDNHSHELFINPDHCSDTQEGTSGFGSSNVAFAIIALGMFLGGFAKSPREPFSTTYIDDNIPKSETALHVGILGSVGILGPALGFGLGGVFSQMYVTLEDVNLTPDDQRWIGAWWLGFLVFGCLSILSAIPTVFFPRRFHPTKTKKKKERKKEERLTAFITGFTASIVRLLKNPIYMLLALTNCIDIFTVSGWVAFEPKYMETQYKLPAWKANLYVGVLAVVPAGIGCLLGGIITSKYKLSPLSCVKFMIGGGISCIILTFLSLFIGCTNQEISGLKTGVDSFPNLSSDLKTSQLDACNDTCICNDHGFYPVCGKDNVTYFSPCHAGCRQFSNKIYSDCTCVASENSSRVASPGFCESDCEMLWPYLIMNFVFGILVTSYTLPVLILFIRCVADEDKSMAMGLMLFLTTLLGWFPAPAIYGLIVDSCCQVWTTDCENVGACALYDIENFRYRRNILPLFLSVVITVLYLVIYVLSKRKKDWSIENTYERKEDQTDTLEGKELLNKSANGEIHV